MPLFWIALAFTCGIWAGSRLTLPWWAWGSAALLIPLAGWFLRRLPGRASTASAWLFERHRELLVAPILLLALLPAGGLRGALARPAPGPTDISNHIGPGTAVVVGAIESPPVSQTGSVQVVVAVQEAQVASASGRLGPAFAASGRLRASLPPDRAWRYGEQVRLTGVLQSPPDGEDYSTRQALARQGIFAEMAYARAALVATGQGSPILAAVYALRERALAVVFALFPPPESALLAGIVLGDDSRIPVEIADAFKATGTAHIIAISGFNIAILAGLLAAASRRIAGPRWGAVLALAGIVFYTVLVGASASVVRAAVMGGLGLFAGQVGRRQVGLNSLGATAFAMLAFFPAWLWDVGFQLTFFATLGMILYASPLQAAFERLAGRVLPAGIPGRVADAVGEYFLFTLAAEVFTLPVQVTQFGRLSLVSLVANPLVLPVQPQVMVIGGLAALAGMAWLPAGQVVAALAWPFVTYTIRVVQALGSLPHAVLFTGPVSAWLAAGWVALAVLPAFGRQRLQRWVDRLRPVLQKLFGAGLRAVTPAVVLFGLGAFTLLVWRDALASLDHRLRLSLVGGETRSALLIQTPGGRALLVDGGSSADRLSLALGQRLPPFPRRLDALVVAGSSPDALAALPDVASLYPPGRVLWLGDPAASPASTRLWDALAATGVPVTRAAPGLRLDLGDGVGLTVLGDAQRSPVALRLEWGAFRALLPLVRPARLPPGCGPVSLLVLPPELLKDTPPGDWQPALHPQAVLVNGMPGAGSESVANLFSTGQNGWIQVSTDGGQLWLEVERK
jgi:competence protein ComEC